MEARRRKSPSCGARVERDGESKAGEQLLLECFGMSIPSTSGQIMERNLVHESLDFISWHFDAS
jgi:hypothetical protein